MTNKHRKRPIALNIRERKIKTNEIPHHAYYNGYNLKKTKNKYWQECGKIGTLMHFWLECKMMQLLWKAVWWTLKKLTVEWSYDPATPLLSVPRIKSRDSSRHLLPVCIAALFSSHRWKQPKCPSAEDWIDKIQCIHDGGAGIYFSLQKEVLIHTIHGGTLNTWC